MDQDKLRRRYHALWTGEALSALLFLTLLLWFANQDGTQLTAQPLFSPDTWFGLLFLGGAVLEQIDDYYVRLMYDAAYDWAYLRQHQRLRRGTIARALDPRPAT